ncbi:hypothetical protein ABPG73_004019 [Tetrahymena malaccensis]
MSECNIKYCQTCNQITQQCTQCQFNLIFDYQLLACVSNQYCQIGFGLDSNQNCVQCSNKSCKVCQYCDSQNQFCSCLSCPDGMMLQKYNDIYQTCVSCNIPNCKMCNKVGSCFACNPGYAINKLTGRCDQCFVENCLDCNDDIKICKKCPGQYYLSLFQGLAKCLPTQQCQQCDDKCNFTQSLANTCQQCIQGYYFYQQSFQSLPQCKQCSQYCSTCTLAPYYCTSCQDGYELIGSQCIRNCRDGYFEIQLNQNRKCFQCQVGCKICSDQLGCFQCFSDYIQDGNNCLPKCNQQQYFASGICSDCDPNCGGCYSSSTSCTFCQLSKFLSTDNKCLDAGCQIDEYQSSQQICSKCTYPCKCSDLFTCTGCNGSDFTFINGACYYQKKRILNCQLGQVQFQKICLDFCPFGTILVGDQCIQNLNGCNQYKLDSEQMILVCLQCINQDYIFYQGSCLAKCPSLMYKATISLVVGSQNYQYTTCVSQCPQNQFSQITIQGRSCVDKCNSSYQIIYRMCHNTPCKQGQYFDNDLYNQSLQSGNPSNDLTIFCKSCDLTCAVCDGNGTWCNKCAPGYFAVPVNIYDQYIPYNLYNCTQSCPSGTKINNINNTCDYFIKLQIDLSSQYNLVQKGFYAVQDRIQISTSINGFLQELNVSIVEKNQQIQRINGQVYIEAFTLQEGQLYTIFTAYSDIGGLTYTQSLQFATLQFYYEHFDVSQNSAVVNQSYFNFSVNNFYWNYKNTYFLPQGGLILIYYGNNQKYIICGQFTQPYQYPVYISCLFEPTGYDLATAVLQLSGFYQFNVQKNITLYLSPNTNQNQNQNQSDTAVSNNNFDTVKSVFIAFNILAFIFIPHIWIYVSKSRQIGGADIYKYFTCNEKVVEDEIIQPFQQNIQPQQQNNLPPTLNTQLAQYYPQFQQNQQIAVQIPQNQNINADNNQHIQSNNNNFILGQVVDNQIQNQQTQLQKLKILDAVILKSVVQVHNQDQNTNILNTEKSNQDNSDDKIKQNVQQNIQLNPINNQVIKLNISQNQQIIVNQQDTMQPTPLVIQGVPMQQNSQIANNQIVNNNLNINNQINQVNHNRFMQNHLNVNIQPNIQNDILVPTGIHISQQLQNNEIANQNQEIRGKYFSNPMMDAHPLFSFTRHLDPDVMVPNRACHFFLIIGVYEVSILAFMENLDSFTTFGYSILVKTLIQFVIPIILNGYFYFSKRPMVQRLFIVRYGLMLIALILWIIEFAKYADNLQNYSDFGQFCLILLIVVVLDYFIIDLLLILLQIKYNSVILKVLIYLKNLKVELDLD